MLECLEQREMMAANIVLVRPITANLTSNIAILQATQQSAQIISVVKQTADRLGAAKGPAAEPVSSPPAKPILAITSKVQPVPTILSTNINYKPTTQQSAQIISPKKELDRAGAAKGSIADAALVQAKTASPVKVVATPAIRVDVSKLQNLQENIHVYISEIDLNALGLISDASSAGAAGNFMENFIFGDRGVQTANRPGNNVGGVDFASAWTQPANPLSTSSLIMGNFAGDRSGHAQEEPPETQEQRNARWMANADEALGMVAAGATIVAFAATLAATSPAWVTGAAAVTFVAGAYYLGAHIAYVAHRNMEPNPDASSRGNVIYMTGRQFDEVVNRNDKTKEPTGEESSSSGSGPVTADKRGTVGLWTSDMGGRVAATPGDARGLRARMESRINIITK